MALELKCVRNQPSKTKPALHSYKLLAKSCLKQLYKVTSSSSSVIAISGCGVTGVLSCAGPYKQRVWHMRLGV